MKRDLSIPLSLIYVLVYLCAGMFVDLPRGFSEAKDPLAKTLLIFDILVSVRIFILWIQTLIHSWKNSDPPSRVAWVLGHLFFGPIVPFIYYFLTDPPKSIQHSNKSRDQVASSGAAHD